MMREYETIYVLKPELDDKSAKAFMLKMKEVVADKGGKNVQVTCMGRRKLAWLRDKHQRGIFVNHTYLGMPGLSKEIERLLGIDDSVMLRQTMLLAKNVDETSKPELEDVLTIEVVRDRREQTQSYFSDDRDNAEPMSADDVRSRPSRSEMVN